MLAVLTANPDTCETGAQSLDNVRVPPPQAYFEPINWHRTALHELAHASGHPSRLNRDLSGGYGTKRYAFEELIALS